MTNYIRGLLCDKHENLRTDEAFDMTIAKNIKETMCLVAQDFDAELKQATEHSTIEKKY